MQSVMTSTIHYMLSFNFPYQTLASWTKLLQQTPTFDHIIPFLHGSVEYITQIDNHRHVCRLPVFDNQLFICVN